MVPAADLALIEEAARKSALVWVRGPHGAVRPLWHVWHEGAVCLVGGPGEQPLDGLGVTDGARVTVSARSKDKGGRLVAWPARVVEPKPGGPEWEAVVAELRAKRLNAVEPEGTAARWAASCRVLRLVPAGPAEQRPGTMPTDGGAAVPPPSPALTRGPMPSGLPTRRRRGGGRGRKAG
ncbi:hypothetical protein [Streptomyces sp. ST2-7A]|uniref:hypothetical protein n=1 Tax=Streptomyces sp. ST2-7A TaxID=2907214 RepID=UPI001F256ED8|nr:hypothetical protein [Streptomyces sp. ST2-7A]MCE7082475.1 hypothetical protein [Streptomyces sp. ST2-7A]